jgi:hypothetical protein
MNDTLSLTEVTELMGFLLRNIRAGGGLEDGTYSLEEVSRRCNVALSSLIKDCRAGHLKHVGKGDHRSMTPSQVAEMLEKYTQGGDLAINQPVAKDDMAEARAASSRAARRQTPRRAVA